MKSSIKVLGLGIAVLGAWHGATAFARPAPLVPLPQPKYFDAAPEKAESSAFAAIEYYQNHCSRCHGYYGMNYDLNSLQKRDDASLKTVLHDMAAGPGGQPLDDAQLEVVTAYHRSMIKLQPFMSVTKIETVADGVMLSGEATPEAKIEIKNGDGSTLATRDAANEYQWQAKLPIGAEAGKLQVTATLKEVVTTVDLAESKYSHSQP
jgi:mono/diheme cytochrome c family protein